MRLQRLALFFGVLLTALSPFTGGGVPLATAHPSLLLPSEAPVTAGYDEGTIEVVGQYGGESRAVAIRGDYAYLAVGRQLVVLDVSDPAQPVGVGQEARAPELAPGRAPTGNFPEVTEIIVAGEYAYLMESSGRGLRIVDVSDPTAPVEVSVYEVEGAEADIAVEGNFVYLANYWGLSILDVSNPAVPTEVGSNPTQANAVAVVGGYAYLGAYSGGLRVIDVSDPSEPQQVGAYPTSFVATDVAVADGYAYLVEHGAGNLRVIDVSDPEAPTQVGLSGVPFLPDDVDVAGDYAYVADGAALHIFNVSNPASPGRVGSLGFSHRALKVAAGNGNAYVATIGGLRIVDVSDPTTPEEVGFYRALNWASSVTGRVGNYAYVVSGDHIGFHIMDVSDPTRPRQVGFYSTTEFINQLLPVQGYLYAFSGTEIHILDISNPTQPQAVSSYPRAGNLLVEGTYGYSMSGGIHILDLSDPAAPQEVGFYPVGGDLHAVVSGLAFVIEGGTLRIIDVSNPAAPVEAGTYQPPDPASGVDVAVVGAYAYLLSHDGMHILDVSDPATPEAVGFYWLEEEIGLFFAAQGQLYHIAHGTFSSQLRIYDVSNPLEPNRVGYGRFPLMGADPTSIQGQYIYTGGEDGFVVLRFEPPAPTAVTLTDLDTSREGPISLFAVLGASLIVLAVLRRRFA